MAWPTYALTPDSLLPNDVMYILDTLEMSRVVTQSVHLPPVGSVLVFDTSVQTDTDYWKDDGYSWVHRGQQKIMGRSLFKRYFSTKHETPGSEMRLQRLCYNLLDDGRYVVVQYIGQKNTTKRKYAKSGKMTHIPPITLSVDKNVSIIIIIKVWHG